MTTQSAREQKIEEVSGKLAKVASVDPNSLARTEELTREINFETAVPHFREMIDVARQLSDRDLGRLPSHELNQVDSATNRLQSLIDQIREFEINQDKPGDVCNELIEQVGSAYDGVVQPLVLPLAFTATQATDYARIEREAKGALSTIKDEQEKVDKYLTEVRRQAASALDEVQKQAAEAGVSQNALIFETAAQTHQKSAEGWLTATRRASAVTFCLSVALLFSPIFYSPNTTPQAVQLIFSKVLVVSVAFFVLVWCSKNYRAARHNETLNKHRADALKTFRAFVEGTSEVAVKDAILVQAAQAAFAPRNTGYDGADGDGPQIQPIVEVFGKSLPAIAKTQ